MKEDLHNIDKLFKSSIEEHEEMPSPGVWNSIDKDLDKNKVIDITRRYLTLRKVAIILLVLLATISLYEFSTWKNNHKIVKNITPLRNNNNDLPANNRGRAAVDKKPAVARKITDPSNSLNGGQAYTESNHAGQDKLSMDSVSSFNKAKLQSVTNDDKKKQQALQYKIDQPVDVSKAKNKYYYRSDRAPQTAQGPVVDEIKNNHLVTEPTLKQNIASVNTDITPVFTGLLKMPESSIDTYRSFSSMRFNKLAPLSTTNNKLNNSIKLTAKKSSRFAATVFFSRDFVFNRLIIDRIGNHERDRDEIRRTEKASSAFTTGVHAEYAINKHWSVQSGVNISKTTIKIEPKIIYARPDDLGNVKFRFNCSAGYSFLSLKTGTAPATGDSLRAFESSNTTEYIGIPVAIKYNVTKGKFRFNAMTGVSINMLSNQKIKTAIANGGNMERSILNDINGLKRSYFSGLFGLGIDYNISKNIALSFIPNARFALTSINKDAPVRSYPQSFGLGAGIRFQL